MARNATLDSRLDSARKAAELERLRLATKALRSIRNGYDFADPTIANRKRRRLASEAGKSEESVFDRLKRDRGVTFCRDLFRNSAGAQAIIRARVHNAVGTVGGKVSCKTGDEKFDKEATAYFNGLARDCMYSRPGRLNEFLRTLLIARHTDGDMAFTVDPALSDGKIRAWETDRICNIEAADWAANAVANQYSEPGPDGTPVPLTQEEGIVRDKTGKVTHIICSSKPGFGAVKWADAAVLSADVVQLYGNLWRENQRRGVPELGLIALELEDIKEMRSRELDTAKLLSSIALTVARKDQTAIEQAIRAVGGDPANILAAAETQAEALSESTDAPAASTGLPRYKHLEEFAGALVEYLDPGDDVQPVKIDRPNMAVGEFANYVHKSAGAGLGVAAAFASWSSDKSYFAFQGDMILSWPTFEELQKDLEYHVCDWLWKRVIGQAIAAGKITAAAPPGWEYAAAWQWPTMPQADKVKHWTAITAAMRIGALSFSDVLGPDWQRKIDDAAAQAEYARKKMPWLALFESKAGAPLGAAAGDGGDEPKTDEGDEQ